jgi:hypothetical protein
MIRLLSPNRNTLLVSSRLDSSPEPLEDFEYLFIPAEEQNQGGGSTNSRGLKPFEVLATPSAMLESKIAH